MNLTDKKCVACEGGTPPLTEKEIANYMAEVKNDWEVVDNKKIRKKFTF